MSIYTESTSTQMMNPTLPTSCAQIAGVFRHGLNSKCQSQAPHYHAIIDETSVNSSLICWLRSIGRANRSNRTSIFSRNRKAAHLRCHRQLQKTLLVVVCFPPADYGFYEDIDERSEWRVIPPPGLRGVVRYALPSDVDEELGLPTTDSGKGSDSENSKRSGDT